MSVASQGVVTSSESADILSQALFQTGLSAPVKTESENAVFDLPEEHLFSCDVQTLTDNLISKMEDNPAQLPSLRGDQEAFSVLGNQNQLQVPAQKDLYPAVTMPQLVSGGGTATNSGYTGGGVMMPKLKKLENGIVPPPQHQTFTPVTPQQANPSPVALQPPPTPQQDVYGPGESSAGFGGELDIELEDLLAIDVSEDQPDISMYSSSINNPPNMSVPQSGYSFATPSSSQSPYPIQTQYNTYQQPTGNQSSPSSQLPELMTDEIIDFLREDSYLMDSSLSSQNNMPYSSQNHNHVHNQYGRPSLPPPPYGSGPSMSNLVTTASLPSSSGSLTGFNIRQHQQVGESGSGRGMLPQQLQRARGRGSNLSQQQPGRFPNRTMGNSLIRQTPPGSTEPVGQVSHVQS